MRHVFNSLHYIFCVTAVVFVLSGADDMFLDLYYYVRFSYRLMQRYPKMTRSDLELIPEKWIAIMIPAWQEYEVIGHMLTRTLKSMQYTNYEIFVGVYPNDLETQQAVDRIHALDTRVHKIIVDNDGPTTKSDCLNCVINGIAAAERAANKRFEVILLHDAEDVVDPLSLKFMNYLVPRFYLVQIPVVPLPVAWHKFTAGTYLDEFAEYHTKDIWVRERMTHMVPSAGVGTGFSREALDLLALQGKIFNIHSLTEDYEISFRLRVPGKRSILLRYMRPHNPGIHQESRLISTREYFPDQFRAAVKQKARWTVGVVFQGWQHIGWFGNLGMRYMLWRDRKAMLTYIFNLLGYIMLATVFSIAMAWFWIPTAKTYLYLLVPRGGWLRDALALNLFFIFWRAVQRSISVYRVAGWRQAMLAILRMPWSNVVNFFAMMRAFRLVTQSIITSKKIVWDKTKHYYPEATESEAAL